MINFVKFYKDKKIYILIVQLSSIQKIVFFLILYYFKYEK